MITIDTENHLNTDFNMMECDFGDAGVCGIRYIMDQLEKRGMRGVFFVDIYAHRQFHGPQADAVESAVRQIHARGHEVGLHAHRDSELPFYKKHLMDCGYQEQRTVYEYGVRFIREITGTPPVSFRGGHYACNEDTFRALSDTGFQVDSSCFYGGDTRCGNRINYYRSLNQPCRVGPLWEFPVVTVVNAHNTFRKFDVNSLTERDLEETLEQMKTRPGFSAASFMLHSFSFVDQKGEAGKKPLYTSDSHSFYGPRPDLMNRFERFLDFIQEDPGVQVVTYGNLIKRGMPDFPVWSDGLFDLCDSRQEAYLPCRRRNSRIMLSPDWRERFFRDEMARRDFAAPRFHQQNGALSGEEAEEIACQILDGTLCLSPRRAPLTCPNSADGWRELFRSAEGDAGDSLRGLTPVRIMTQAFENTGRVEFLRWAYDFLLYWEKSRDVIRADAAAALSQTESLLDYGAACTRAGLWRPEFLESLFRMLREAAESLSACPAGRLEERKNRALLGAGTALYEEKLCQDAKYFLSTHSKDGKISKLLREFDAYWFNPFPEVLSDKGRF